ncbi:MAG: thioredoxin [Treponema sp.]|jgi:thioredoxin 1|nr:thioredoxin [Treponema sp.]
MSVTTLTEKNFEQEVLKNEKPVLIDFWASWCGPCRMLSPLVDELADEHSEFKFCKVNVDEEEALAKNFGIMSIPTLIVFKNGEQKAKSIGAIPKDAILELIKNA